MKTIKYFFSFIIAAVFAVMVAPELFSEAIVNFVLGGGGAILGAAGAAASIADEPVTTHAASDASPNLLRPEISQIISKIRPDVFPMDTILREVGNVGSCDSREYKYYSVDVRGVADKVSVEVPFAETATTDVGVNAVHQWLVDDIVFFPTVVNTRNEEVRAQVLATDPSSNSIEIKALNGVGSGGMGDGDFMPLIPAAAPITRIGNAKDEIAAQNAPYATMPSDTYNYVQILMCQVEESFVELQHNKEVEYNINDFRTDAIYDLRRVAELSMLFGYPKKDFFDPIANSKKDMMGGARHFISKVITYDPSVTASNAIFNAWARIIFTGNNGSYRRILFAGNKLVEWLMNVPMVEKQLQANKSEIVAGIKFKLIETYFGDLLVRRHQGFDDVAGYDENGLVLDLDNVERRYREPTHSDKLELDKTGQRRVNAFRIVEAWTMAFRNPETHAWIEAS